MTRAEMMELLAPELSRVEKAISDGAVCSVEAVTAISQHLQLSGGKRLRPALLLLAAGACGYRGESAIRMSAVMEIIHTATLVHDDVIDNAQVRRGQPSINRQWGNHTSVLAGDWLYMRAFSLALRGRNFYVLDLLIDLTQMMVEGELMQLELAGRLSVTEQEYLELVHRKTAALFSLCARLGAVLGSVDSDSEQRLADYGWNLGMAFQLIDDVLDFSATEETLGKPVGSDLREGKITLPMILTLKQCLPHERETVKRVVKKGCYDEGEQAQILGLLDRYGSISAVRRRATDFTQAAAERLDTFPETPYKRALVSLTDLVVDRDS